MSAAITPENDCQCRPCQDWHRENAQTELSPAKLSPDEARLRLMNRLYEVRLQTAEIAHGLSLLGDLSAGTFLNEAHLDILAACEVMEAKHPELT